MSAGNKEEREQLNLNVKKSGEQFRVILKVLLALLAVIILTAAVVLIRIPFKGGMYAPEWGWWPMYDLGEYPVCSDTDWQHYGGGPGAEYWGTMIVSGGLAGEHGLPRINNPMEISVVDVG